MSEISIGQALQKFLKKAKWESPINAIRVTENWEAIMGKTISKYTDKVQLRGEILFIYTTVGPLKQELSAGKEQIIKRVNEYLQSDTVKKVVIK